MSGSGVLPPTGIWKLEGDYPSVSPYNPDTAYPEYRGQISEGPNPVYEGVRQLFHLMGYDEINYGTPHWNPLQHLVKPGDRVFIKPNLVSHEYRTSSGRNGDLYSVITHPAVVRAVADYVAIALQGRGEIVIGDNPSIDADFSVLCTRTKLKELETVYRQTFGLQCRVLDLRPMWTDDLKYYGFKSKAVPQSGDPEGSSVLDLGKHSFFHGLNPRLFRGVFTKRLETIRHHLGDLHEYSISNTILNSDVYISIPKLKAHHKVGATLNIKGLVGVNSNKNYLIHWRIGFPLTGGDEFPTPSHKSDYLMVMLRHLMHDLLPESWFLWLRHRFQMTRFESLFKDTKCASFDLARGSWDGNDTCWRMAADLYNVFVRDLSGWQRRRGHKMRFFSVVDGILGGEENGPFYPLEKKANVLLAGEDLLLVDCAAARLMDFDPIQIPYLRHLLSEQGIDLETVPVLSNFSHSAHFFYHHHRYLGFKPPTGWTRLALMGDQS